MFSVQTLTNYSKVNDSTYVHLKNCNSWMYAQYVLSFIYRTEFVIYMDLRITYKNYMAHSSETTVQINYLSFILALKF